jgi:hypothetical protein
MIIFCEGPRHSGKTHLIDAFLAQNENPDIIYYKFKFAKYIEDFDIQSHETGPGVHYFSIGNILTILELNKTLFKDKIILFDRCIYSAYVWSIYRNRMDRTLLLNEFEKILNSELYEDCALLHLTRGELVTAEKRNKDYFGNFEDYAKEKQLFDEIIGTFHTQASDSARGNSYITYTNNFDEPSVDDFCKLVNGLVKQK